MRLALFDFDKTICPGDSIVPFLRFLTSRGILRRSELFCAAALGMGHAVGLMSDRDAKERALSPLRGRTEEELLRLGAAFFADTLEKRLFPGAVARLRQERQSGRTIFVVTASPVIYLQPLVTLGLCDELLGTELAVQHGVLTGQLLGENCKGEEKCRRIARRLDELGVIPAYDDSVAVADGESDAPMLALARTRVLVHPGKALRRRFPDAEIAPWG